ncbi:hypothetical protein SO802_013954 [Lithocarpus litseifolius]|uniref:U1-type domain-containing protein n=1 Tax=Lithocarpus litseifolius TaxID=425828 RepID=A0AAW2D717_9ROSI
MPLGKYYCDYCDKEFQDTPYVRKRHLQGLQHLRNKALWFDSFQFKDANQAYTEGFGKGVCNRFVKTNNGLKAEDGLTFYFSLITQVVKSF